ncbi:hypothetical protein NIES22_66570 [Calothrix brevissima NIES-22]|nr:hypothetical protein NIES22_66570 [Calothrix brevissima NIES-22]
MIGSREWISRVQDIISESKQNGDNFSNNSDKIETPSYFEEVLKQGKKISHLISHIWLEQDKEAAQELDGYFKRANTEKGKEDFKKLLMATKETEPDKYNLLDKIFKENTHLYLPIFHPDDAKFFEFRVVFDKFEGNISDIQPNGKITITIPYPPRPEIFDDIDEVNNTTVEVKQFTVIKQSELREWLKPDLDKDYIFEANPYIPVTSS